MRAALITEYRKLVTTRLWWVLLLSMAAYMVLLGGILAFSFTIAPGSGAGSSGGTTTGVNGAVLSPRAIAIAVYTLATSLGYVFPVIVGALSVTGEVRHHTLTPTFLAEPRRGVVLAAKMLSSLPVGLLFGLVGTASTAAAGAVVLAFRGKETFLTDPAMLRTLGLSVVALAVWCSVGVGFGAVLTNQVAAVVVLLAFTQFVEPLLRLLLGQLSAVAGVSKFLPGAAGEAITGGSFYSASGLATLLSPWQGFAVLVGYAVVFAVTGRFAVLNRDIT
jgi:hypothetical protein